MNVYIVIRFSENVYGHECFDGVYGAFRTLGQASKFVEKELGGVYDYEDDVYNIDDGKTVNGYYVIFERELIFP